MDLTINVNNQECPVRRVLAAIESTDVTGFQEYYRNLAGALGLSLEGGGMGIVWQQFRNGVIGLSCALGALIEEWAIRGRMNGGRGAKLTEFLHILDHLALAKAKAALENEFKVELVLQHSANQNQPLGAKTSWRRDIYGNTRLHQAVLSSNVDEVKRLLETGLVGVNARNNHKLTPLHCAGLGSFSENRWILIKMLIGYGADPLAVDVTNETFIHKLEYFNNDQFHEIAVYLIKRHCSKIFNVQGGARNCTAFHAVCSQANMGELKDDTIDLLYENGAKFDCVDRERDGILKDVVVNGWGNKMIEKLVRYGASYRKINIQRENLIHVAALAGNVTALEGFISKGIDLNHVDQNGNTPMHMAMRMQKPENDVLEVVKILLGKGATATRNHKGMTPRDLAVENKLSSVINYLDLNPMIVTVD